MALVQELYDTIDFNEAICGRFLDDGEYYFAVFRDYSEIQIYTIKSRKPIKVHTIDTLKMGYHLSRTTISTYYTTGSRDYILIARDSDDITVPITLIIWTGNEFLPMKYASYYDENTDYHNKVEEVYTSPNAPGVFCTVVLADLQIKYSWGDEFEFDTEYGVMDMVFFTEKLSFFSTIDDGYFVNSDWPQPFVVPLNDSFVTVMLTSKHSQTQFLWFERDGAYLFDIDAPMRAQKRRISLGDVSYIQNSHFLKYDEVSGNAVFMINSEIFFIYDGSEAIRLRTKGGIHAFPLYPCYLLDTERGNQKVYAYKLKENYELEYEEIGSTFSNVLLGPHEYVHNLLGSNYYFENESGLARLSNKMWLEPFNTSLIDSPGPVEDIFLLNDHLILISFELFSVVLDLNGIHHDSWYKPGKSVYACATYQVQSDAIYTKGSMVHNPLNSEIIFANSHGDLVLIGSTCQVALINSELQVLQTYDEGDVVDVFPGGYATNNKVKIFGKPDINVPGIITAGYSSSVLFVETGGSSLLYSVDGGDLVECNLGIGVVRRIYDCGVGCVLQTDNEQVLFHNREFIRLEGAGSKCLFFGGLRCCCTIENGILCLKINTGIHSSVTIDPICRESTDISTRICKDKAVLFHEDPSRSVNLIHIKSLNNRMIEYRKLPQRPGFLYSYFIVRDKYLVEAAYGPQYTTRPRLLMAVYRTSDMVQISGPTVVVCQTMPLKYWNNPSWIIQRDLKSLIRLRFDENELFFTPSAMSEIGHRVEETLYIFKIDENGIIKPKHNRGALEVLGVNVNPFTDLNHKVGINPSEYPAQGNHLLTYRNGKFYSCNNDGVPTDKEFPVDRKLLAYTNSTDSPNVYHTITDSDDFKVETFNVKNGKKEYIGRVIIREREGNRSASVVSKSSTSLRHGPKFIVSTGSRVFAITPINNEYDLKGIESIMERHTTDREQLPVADLIDAPTLLTILRHDGSHEMFREIGEDTNFWKSVLIKLLR